jgi:hypothetical protein
VAPRKLGTVQTVAKGSDFTLRCAAAAIDKTGYRSEHLAILSAVGPSTSVKAMAALLHSKVGQVRFTGCDPIYYGYYQPYDNGYRIYKHYVSEGQWHMLAIAKDKRLIPDLTEQAFWNFLRSEHITTPVLRSWTPWIMQAALADERGYRNSPIEKLSCFNCNAVVVVGGTDYFDDLVSRGVREGHLKIVE